VLSISVALLAPAGVASNSSCSFAATAQVAATVLSAATGVTLAYGGEPSCGAAAAARRALQAGSGSSSCSTSSTTGYIYFVPVIVPLGGSATAAQSAITALSASAFFSTLSILANASGCSAAAFTFGAPIVAAASCGSAGDSSVPCILPAPTTLLNTGALIGGLVGGGALLIIFVTLVLVLRGCCRRCGACCPQRLDKALGVEAPPPAEATPAPPAAAVAVAA